MAFQNAVVDMRRDRLAEADKVLDRRKLPEVWTALVRAEADADELNRVKRELEQLKKELKEKELLTAEQAEKLNKMYQDLAALQEKTRDPEQLREELKEKELLIAEQKAQLKKIPDPWHQGHPINAIKLDIHTWIDYFRCYDLRQCEGKTFGQIAAKVYGDSTKKYENAETAYKRVSKLIHYAESNNWPPPTNFLNAK